VGEELRLMLARLFKLSALFLDFIKQPHVLNRDRGLVGEGRDQFNLLISEWPYLRACQAQKADGHAFAHHWDAEDRAVIPQSLCFNQGIFWISFYVGNMNHSTFE